MTERGSSERLPHLDAYDILEELGHGGMATVYRARDPRLEREVAVKLIHKHLRENPEVRRRFVAEARAVAKLRHPGIVDVYDVSSDDDDERYLVVELIRGTTLRRVLDEHGTLPPEVAAGIVRLLCDAVQHAHDSGVIHRDIKPENVLIDRPMASERVSSPRVGTSSSRGRVRVKLTDFGIAKVLDAQGVTATGQILGSPAHMAPEQIEGGTITAATDVFALGVLMYECLVGHLPFQGSNPAQVLRNVLSGAFEAADLERPQVGGRWAVIVAAALQVDPARRIPSAAALGEAIDAELTELGARDVQGRLDAFFADPEGFRREHEAALVETLLARGERARHVGDVHGAAADFNRALALRPDDLAILKRVSTLTAARTWRRRRTRIAAIAVAAAGLGTLAFVAARAVRQRPVVHEGGGVAIASNRAEEVSSSKGMPERPSTERRAAPESLEAEPLRPVPEASSRIANESPRSRGLRRVRLVAVPAGARLRVDGADVAWFGRVLELAPGVHRVVGYMPDDHPCCATTNVTITVTDPPVGGALQEQTFTVALPFQDARVTLVGGPPNARVTCDNGVVFGAGAAGIARMSDLVRRTTCTFMPGNVRQTITLQAGVPAPVPWPG